MNLNDKQDVVDFRFHYEKKIILSLRPLPSAYNNIMYILILYSFENTSSKNMAVISWLLYDLAVRRVWTTIIRH